jgi:hypothetical protein
LPWSRATASFVVSARCCFIIAFVIESGQLFGFALLRKTAIWCAFAYQAASAWVSFGLSPAFAAASTGTASRMCTRSRRVSCVPAVAP